MWCRPGNLCLLSTRTLKQSVRKLFSNNHKATTISGCCQQLEQAFMSQKISEPKESAEYIVAHVLGYKTLHGLDSNLMLYSDVLTRIALLAKQRLSSVPLQYIIGEWDFCDSVLSMRPPVFIPRPETEELVNLAFRDPIVATADKFLEVGSGSGAICITLLKHLSNLKCTAVDVNPSACQLTKENAVKNGVGDRLNVLCTSFDQEFVSTVNLQGKKFDFLISNPPYIPDDQVKSLQPEIVNYEDHRALSGGPDGLAVINQILQYAPTLVKEDGSVWLEVDLTHPDKIKDFLKSSNSVQFAAAFDDFTRRPRFCHLKVSQHG